MGGSTGAGSTLAIGMGVPATGDAAGFAALTYTEIGNVQKIGTLGGVFEKTEFKPFQGPKQKYKSSVDYGSLTPLIAHDESDAGQAILRVAADDETNRLFPFVVTYPTGAKRYFQGRVFGYPETVDGADEMLTVTPIIEICTKPIKTGAGVPTPTPSPSFSGKPTISPTSGDTSVTYTATDPTINNGTITSRVWLIGTTVIGTGPSIVPGVGNDGQLSRRVSGIGDDGTPITTTSNTITVVSAAANASIYNTPGNASLRGNEVAGFIAAANLIDARLTALGV